MSNEAYEEPGEVVEGRSLDELAAIIRREHVAVEVSGAEAMRAVGLALRHAMVAGEALWEARRQVATGDWTRWVTSATGLNRHTATSYIRLSLYREDVQRWLADGGSGHVRDALVALRGLPPVARGGPPPLPLTQRRRIQQLAEAGLSQRAIADTVGVRQGTVCRLLHPDRAKANARAQKQRRLQRERDERDGRRLRERENQARQVKSHGGAASRAYGLIRQCAVALDDALGEARDATEREHLRSAINSAHQVEYRILDALKIERQR